MNGKKGKFDLVTSLKILLCISKFDFIKKYQNDLNSHHNSMFYATTLTDSFFGESIQKNINEPKNEKKGLAEDFPLDKSEIEYEMANAKRVMFFKYTTTTTPKDQLKDEANEHLNKLKNKFAMLGFSIKTRIIQHDFLQNAKKFITEGKNKKCYFFCTNNN